MKYCPLPQHELAICKRLREVRKMELATQERFARALKISRDQLASIEVGRVPVSFRIGWRLCELMHLNPLWLASGESDWQTTFAPFDFGAIQPNARFSEVMSSHREQYRVALETHIREMVSPAKEAKERKLWDQLLLSWGIYLSNLDAAKLLHQVRWAAAIYPVVKKSLTIVPDVFDSLVSMRTAPRATSRWKQLQRRLRMATRTRGAKASLARELGVDRQLVTEWLKHATRGPSAETALRLLEWIGEIEAKKQNAGSAVTPPAPKTRKSKSTKYEKAKSSRRKQ
jgi:transcriptional regulator with XRE-family HTH domain